MQLLSGHVTPFFCKNKKSIQKPANEVHPQLNPATLFTLKNSSAVHFNIIFPYTALGHPHKKGEFPITSFLPLRIYVLQDLFYRLPSLGQRL